MPPSARGAVRPSVFSDPAYDLTRSVVPAAAVASDPNDPMGCVAVAAESLGAAGVRCLDDGKPRSVVSRVAISCQDLLPQDVTVSAVPGEFLDHVQVDPT